MNGEISMILKIVGGTILGVGITKLLPIDIGASGLIILGSAIALISREVRG